MLCAVVFAVDGCSKSTKESAAPKKEEAKQSHTVAETDLNRVELTAENVRLLALKTGKIEERSMPQVRVYGGDFALPTGTSVIVATPLAGTLVVPEGRAFPLAGQRVKEGEPLLTLVPLLTPERDVLTPSERIRVAESRAAVAQSQTDAAAAVDQAKVQVEAAQIAVDRAERLLADKSGTVRAVDEANAVLQLAQRSLTAANERKNIVDNILLDSAAGKLESKTITAPLSGMLRMIQAQPGQTLPAASPLFEIMDDTKLWVRVPVYVGDVATLAVDQPAQLMTMAGRPREPEQLVNPVEAPPTALATASTVDLYYELDNTKSEFRPGQKIAVQLTEQDDEKVKAVPWTAVYHDIYGGQWVYELVGERQYVRQRVEVTSVSDGWAALNRGPAVGTDVVTAGVAELSGFEFGFAH